MQKYFKAKNDAMFKAIFCNENNRDLLTRLLEDILDTRIIIKKVSVPELIKKNIYVKGTNDEEAPSGYDLTNYYTKISNYSTITSLPTENANYIVEALPHVYSCYNMLLGCSSLRNIYFF